LTVGSIKGEKGKADNMGEMIEGKKQKKKKRLKGGQ